MSKVLRSKLGMALLFNSVVWVGVASGAIIFL